MFGKLSKVPAFDQKSSALAVCNSTVTRRLDPAKMSGECTCEILMSTFVGHRRISSREAWRPAWDHLQYLQTRKGKDLEKGASRPIFGKNRNSIPFDEVLNKIQNVETTAEPTTYAELLLAPNTVPDEIIRYARFVFLKLDVFELEWFAVAHNHSKKPHVHAIVIPRIKRSQRELINWDLVYDLRLQSNYYLYCLDSKERAEICIQTPQV